MQSFRKGMGTARRDKNKGRSQGLTEEQKQEIREAFDLFDTDGSGMLNQIYLSDDPTISILLLLAEDIRSAFMLIGKFVCAMIGRNH
jgi:hypothetical protein